jgi:hypothetical protein
VIQPVLSDITGSSILELQVYSRDAMRCDNYIGGMKDAVDVFLTEGAAEGHVHSLE